MSIHRIQTAKGGDGSGGTFSSLATANFGSSVSVNNWIVVGVRSGAAADVSSVTDTLGNTYTRRAADRTHDPYLYLYDATVTTGGTNAVTANFSANTTYGWVFAIELTTVSASGFDTSVTNDSGATTDLTSGSITTAQSIEYAVMFGSQNNFATYSAATDSASNSWTLIDGTIGGSGNNFGGAEEFVTAAALAADIAHLTSSVSAQFTTVCGAYKDSGSALTVAKEIGIYDQLLSSQWIGRMDS